MKKAIKNLLRGPAEAWLYYQWKDVPFCLISNDCFGGEVYKYARRPYNTPFVGLMIMIPCYLKLLSDLKSYLACPLQFLSESSYREMNEFREKNKKYPLGLLKDIEIHFLHYSSEGDALETWNRRCSRMDFANLRVKCSLGKDYATEQHAADFAALSIGNKLCVGPGEVLGAIFYWQVPGLDNNAVIAFRQSLCQIDLTSWLKGSDAVRLNGFSKYWYNFLATCQYLNTSV